MRTHEEIIERLIQRYIDLESLIRFYYQKSIEHEDNGRLKAKKICENNIMEYQAEQREVIRVYAYIFDIDFIDAVTQLSEEYVKENGNGND